MIGEGGPAVCVFCKRHPVEPSWRPFCSERCRLQDLARWADGTYRVPGEPVERTAGEHPETETPED
jgi:endogenous inhibitor of DNA gyrase (YacG/DUF329 family)